MILQHPSFHSVLFVCSAYSVLFVSFCFLWHGLWSLQGAGLCQAMEMFHSTMFHGKVTVLSCYMLYNMLLCYINGIVMFVFVLSPDSCDFWGRSLRRGATGNAVLVPRGRATGQWMGARWCQAMLAMPVVWCFKMFHAWTYCHPRFTWSIVSPEVCLCPQMALSANRFFVQSDTQDSCGFTTRAFQAHFLENKYTLPLRIMIEFNWLSWKEIESSSHFLHDISRGWMKHKEKIYTVWEYGQKIAKKAVNIRLYAMCLHPAVPQILRFVWRRGLALDWWIRRRTIPWWQQLHGLPGVPGPRHRVFGIFWAGVVVLHFVIFAQVVWPQCMTLWPDKSPIFAKFLGHVCKLCCVLHGDDAWPSMTAMLWNTLL